MSVRVLTTRMVLPGKEGPVLKHLKRLQAEAIGAPGFLASTAYREVENPAAVVVMSEWHDVGSWNRWLDRMERGKVLDEMRHLLYGPITHKVLAPIKDLEAEVFLM